MKKLHFNWKGMAVALLTVTGLQVSAQEAHFDFNAQETKEYAEFFKQPSALEGKCNAEVMGIDIKREGFSWDDMNTWLNSEGKLWHNNKGQGYAETLFGVCVNTAAPFNGRTSSLSWTTNDNDNKWYPAIENCKYLKGRLVLTDCWATVVHISGTEIESVKITMNNADKDCYLHVRRNPLCREVDLTDSKGKLREFHGYSNAFSDENSFRPVPGAIAEFLTWLINIENNCYTFSTLPKHPATGLKLGAGYKDQWKSRGGYPIGLKNADGDYEIEVDEDIDLSMEYDIEGKITNYVWKDLDGNVVDVANDRGFFCFGEEHVGKTYRCEMTNGSYSLLTLNTVWVTVVEQYSSGVGEVSASEVRIVCNDNAVKVLGAEDMKGVQVYSLNGQCVKNHKGACSQFNVSDLSSGMYIVKVTTADGTYTEKIIKK